MRLFRVFLLLVLLLSGVAAPARAQFGIPPLVDRFELETGSVHFSIGVPEGWQIQATQPGVYPPYGTLSGVPAPGQTMTALPTQVQVVVRPVEELGESLQVNTEALNPALDYFVAYAEERVRAGVGAYTTPVALRSGNTRAALMLYTEGTQNDLFGAGEYVLSLGFATYVGNDEMLIVLFEGPVNSWALLLSLWNTMLASIELNYLPMDFEEDVAQVLIGFGNPETLVARYQSGELAAASTPDVEAVSILPNTMSETDTLTDGVNTLEFPLLEGWTRRDLEPGALLLENATYPEASMEVRLVPQPDYPNPIGWVDENYGDRVVAEAIGFEWPPFVALGVPLREDGIQSTLIVAQIPEQGGYLLLRFNHVRSGNAQLDSDFAIFASLLNWNGEALSTDQIVGALLRVGEMGQPVFGPLLPSPTPGDTPSATPTSEGE